MRLDSADIGHLFDLLDQLPDGQVEAVLRTLATMAADDVVAATDLLSGLSPSALRRLIGLARQPGVVKVLGATLGRGR